MESLAWVWIPLWDSFLTLNNAVRCNLVMEHNHSRRWRMYADERNTYNTPRYTQDFILGPVWRVVANTQTGYIVASLAWVRVQLRDSFLTFHYLTPTLTATLTRVITSTCTERHNKLMRDNTNRNRICAT